MKQLTISEIQQIEYELLIQFDEYCHKNRITYFLSNGTLLGAIKYKGFIPWDDDIDVLVPREDYNRLINSFKDNEQLRLFSYERNKNYRFPFAKLCDIHTIKEEYSYENSVNLGLNIDIFPLDYWKNDLMEAKKESKIINRYMLGLTLSKLKKSDSINPIKRFIKSFFITYCKMLGNDFFIKRIINLSNSATSSYVGCKSWCIYGEREIIPADVFYAKIDVEFSGRKFPAPIGYDVYLRSLYGNYENDPPKEKQKTHHSYNAYIL